MMNNQEHSFFLENRSKAHFTGINDVKSFDEQEVVLDTVQGLLTLQGKLLHVKSLDLASGEADIDGNIDRMVYTAKKDMSSRCKSFAARMFR